MEPQPRHLRTYLPSQMVPAAAAATATHQPGAGTSQPYSHSGLDMPQPLPLPPAPHPRVSLPSPVAAHSPPLNSVSSQAAVDAAATAQGGISYSQPASPNNPAAATASHESWIPAGFSSSSRGGSPIKLTPTSPNRRADAATASRESWTSRGSSPAARPPLAPTSSHYTSATEDDADEMRTHPFNRAAYLGDQLAALQQSAEAGGAELRPPPGAATATDDGGGYAEGVFWMCSLLLRP